MYDRKMKHTKLLLVTFNSFIYRIQCYFSFCILIFLVKVASSWNMYSILFAIIMFQFKEAAI